MIRKLIYIALLLTLCACGSQTAGQYPTSTYTVLPPTNTFTSITTSTATQEPTPSLSPIPESSPTLTEVPAQFVVDDGVVKVWDSSSGGYRDLVVPESVVFKHGMVWNEQTNKWEGGDVPFISEEGKLVYENPIYRTTLDKSGEVERIEYLQTTCLAPEFKQHIEENFYKKTGYTIEEALNIYMESDLFDRVVSYTGYTSMPEYFHRYQMGMRYLLVGGGTISLEDIPGAQNGDFVQCAFLVNYGTGADRFIPGALGTRWQGKWQPSGYFVKFTDAELLTFEKFSIENTSQMDGWLNDNLGCVVDIPIVLSFDQDGAWSRSHTAYPDTKNDVAENSIKIMTAMSNQAYFKRFTRNPELLGYQMHTGFAEIFSEIDEEHDIGLFIGPAGFGPSILSRE